MKKLFLLIPAFLLSLAVSASTDFAAPGYYCAADDAVLANVYGLSLVTSAEPHYIQCAEATYNVVLATWTVSATRGCYISVSLDLGSYDSNKHIFEVKILQGSTEIGTVAEGAADPSASTDGYKNDYDKVKPLEGSIFIPEAGEYTVELRSIRKYGKGAVKNVILTYAGGAQINIPAANIPFGDAIFSTHAWLDKTGTSDSIRFARASNEGEAADASYTVAGSEYVKWNVRVANDGYYKFTANTYCKQGHNYRIMLLSADESATIHTWQEAADDGFDFHNEKANWEISTDVWNIPAGNYVLKVQAKAYGRLLSLAGTYVGGAVQTLPTTTDNSEAWFSPKGTRADGMITFTTYTDQWVKWNIAAPGSVTRAYNVALNINNPTEYGHCFSVSFYETDAAEPFATLTESEWNKTYGTPVSIPMGIVNLDGGNSYIVKVTNSESGAQPKIISLSFTDAGGDIQDISTSINTSLDVADAWFEGCTRGADRIVYPSSGTSSAWIKWNIAATETKFYDLTLNINAPNAHGFTAALYEDESASPVASVTEGSYVNTTGVLALELGRVNLVGGKNYVVKLTNAPGGSVAEVLDLTFAPVAASATELPGTLAFSNAVLSARAHVTDGKLYFAPIGDTNPEGEWARWAVITDHAGLFLFTMGVNSTNSQSYKISIYNNLNTRIDFYEAKPSSGAQTLKHYFSLPAGNYSVQVENTTAWSNGYLTSLGVTEPAGVVTIDESATDNTAWADKVVDKSTEGPLYDVQIIRSFKGGMNNTFCLPFAVSSTQCEDIFGSDVEIYTLGEATIEDYILNLTVNPASDIYPGTPVLIKPARDIVNPVFTDVKFTAYTASATTKTRANFVGSFVKTPLTASDNLLYVGPENKVFFLSVDYDMPGMRAWFEIHDVPAALSSPKALRSARIIEKEQITTSILNVETSGDAARKVLYNGQIVIIRGNEMYNMQGQHIQ